jgi:hypothetical protein
MCGCVYVMCGCVYVMCGWVSMCFFNLFIKHVPLLGVILHAIINILIYFAGNAVTSIVAPVAAFSLQF